MKKQYYITLGVSEDATQDEIKKAYRKLATEHHPDKGGDSAVFNEITEAYQCLCNEVTRTQYDKGEYTLEQRILDVFEKADNWNLSVIDIAAKVWPDKWRKNRKSHGYLTGTIRQAVERSDKFTVWMSGDGTRFDTHLVALKSRHEKGKQT